MPFFLPAFDKTSQWRQVGNIPTAIVLRFHQPNDLHELYRFIDILTRYIDINRGSYVFNPMPIVRNDNGKEVPLGLLSLIRKRRLQCRLSFYLFGDYFRDILRDYCIAALDFYEDDEEICSGFHRLLSDYALSTSRGPLN